MLRELYNKYKDQFVYVNLPEAATPKGYEYKKNHYLKPAEGKNKIGSVRIYYKALNYNKLPEVTLIGQQTKGAVKWHSLDSRFYEGIKDLEEIKKSAQWKRSFLNMRYPTESTIQRMRELDDIIRNPEKVAKVGIVEGFERWMYARDFSRKHSEIVDRYPDCICSHDGHGFRHAKGTEGYSYQLTEDITFTFRTNFAYGKSSRFFLNVEYI